MSKNKKIIIVAIVLVVLLIAYYYFFVNPPLTPAEAAANNLAATNGLNIIGATFQKTQVGQTGVSTTGQVNIGSPIDISSGVKALIQNGNSIDTSIAPYNISWGILFPAIGSSSGQITITYTIGTGTPITKTYNYGSSIVLP
jgi:hypothetical protein